MSTDLDQYNAVHISIWVSTVSKSTGLGVSQIQRVRQSIFLQCCPFIPKSICLKCACILLHNCKERASTPYGGYLRLDNFVLFFSLQKIHYAPIICIHCSPTYGDGRLFHGYPCRWGGGGGMTGALFGEVWNFSTSYFIFTKKEGLHIGNNSLISFMYLLFCMK